MFFVCVCVHACTHGPAFKLLSSRTFFPGFKSLFLLSKKLCKISVYKEGVLMLVGNWTKLPAMKHALLWHHLSPFIRMKTSWSWANRMENSAEMHVYSENSGKAIYSRRILSLVYLGSVVLWNFMIVDIIIFSWTVGHSYETWNSQAEPVVQ